MNGWLNPSVVDYSSIRNGRISNPPQKIERWQLFEVCCGDAQWREERVTFMSHIFDSYCLTIDSSCSAYNICTIALNCHPKKHVLQFIFASPPPPLTHIRSFQGDVLHYEVRVNTTFLYKNFYIGCQLDFTVHYQLSSQLWICTQFTLAMQFLQPRSG